MRLQVGFEVNQNGTSGLDPEKSWDRHTFLQFLEPGSKDVPSQTGLRAGKVMTFIGIRGVQPSVPTWMSELNPPARARAALGTSSGRCCEASCERR